jgi:Uma2 family endonuclease
MSTPTVPPTRPAIPPLEEGQCLSREEFERRYDAMPQLKKAELIDGVVHMPSPVRLNHHGSPHILLGGWLCHYWAATPGVQAADNATVRLDLDNEPQPDAILFVQPPYGGQVTIDPDDYVNGGPELVAEVAASSASIDLGAKLRAYRLNGVVEYIVWRVNDQAIDWFTLRQTDSERLPLAPDGFYRSVVFPGLWLDPTALFRFDVLGVLRVLHQGLASPEHAAFVALLQQRRASQG